MRLILVNGVYGATAHFDALRAAFAPDISTEVFTFSRDGATDPDPEHAFDPMVRRLESVVRGASPDPTGASRPALLGFSLGGALSLEYVLQHPDHVSALVLVNSFDRYHLAGIQPGAVPPFWRVPVPIVHRSFIARIIHRIGWLRRGLLHEDATLDDVDRGMRGATAEVSSADLRYQLAHLGLPVPSGQGERLAALAERLPVLLLSSRRDMVVPPFHTDRLAQLMPAARRLPAFEGGHAFFQHDGSEVARVVREFLSASHSLPAVD